MYSGGMDKLNLATRIVKRLVDEGHIAYFAGGWVRDYVMGHPSADIDIATDASPQKILSLFPNTIQVGMLFGVIVVSINGMQFEIATFRKDVGVADGRRPVEVIASNPQEDALRRDFTINGMFYNPLDHQLHDFVGGVEDIKRKVIRAIGDPELRFHEDRLRMIRAVRFSVRFGFEIESETQKAILKYADTLIPAVSLERVWQEFKKMSDDGHFPEALIKMDQLRLLQAIFPEITSYKIQELENIVRPLKNYPKGTPTIAFLLPLFPKITPEDAEDLCRFLKASNKDIKFAHLLIKALRLVDLEENHFQPECHDWVYFYSEDQSDLIIDIISCHYPDDKRRSFLDLHRSRKEKLNPHIKRIQEKKPLVNSSHLLQSGVQPGKEMGVMLKEAERIAINRDLHDPQAVLQILKKEMGPS
jgi:poly(A) polymerase